jgi:hypothetical protein
MSEPDAAAMYMARYLKEGIEQDFLKVNLLTGSLGNTADSHMLALILLIKCCRMEMRSYFDQIEQAEISQNRVTVNSFLLLYALEC